MKLIKNIEAAELPDDIRKNLMKTLAIMNPRDSYSNIYQVGFEDGEYELDDHFSEEYLLNKKMLDDYLIKTFKCYDLEDVLISFNDFDIDLYIELNDWLRQ